MNFMRRTIALLLLATLCLRADGPEFEVASIKAIPPNPNGFVVFGPQRGGPGTADPTHIAWPSATLRNVLTVAFGVKNFQVSGPDTLDSERFEFAVGVPEGATKDQVALMWRNLLFSRFDLKYHIEQREFNVDQLQVGPKGHKLLENKDDVATSAQPAKPPVDGPPQMDANGRPVMNGPGMMMMIGAGPNGPTAKASGKAQAMSALVDMISNQVGHPVVDKTGLTGKYDFFVEFAPALGPAGAPLLLPRGGGPGAVGAAQPPAGGAAELGLELPQALEQQLGLRLVKGKGMLDVIVVEKINRSPTEN
jgi:uncharacterized protein (TIGR03435 family)